MSIEVRPFRCVGYVGPGDEQFACPFLESLGFCVVKRTERGWRRFPATSASAG